jgi:hypothetical protein
VQRKYGNIIEFETKSTHDILMTELKEYTAYKRILTISFPKYGIEKLDEHIMWVSFFHCLL